MELLWARKPIDRAVAVNFIFTKSTANMSQGSSTLLLYDQSSLNANNIAENINESIVWTNHIVKRILFICAYASVCYSAVHLCHKQEEVFLLSQVRRTCFQRVYWSYPAVLCPYYICLRSVGVIHFFGRIFFNSSGAFWLTSKTSAPPDPFFSLPPLSEAHQYHPWYSFICNKIFLELKVLLSNRHCPKSFIGQNNMWIQFLWLTHHKKGALVFAALWQLFHKLDKVRC